MDSPTAGPYAVFMSWLPDRTPHGFLALPKFCCYSHSFHLFPKFYSFLSHYNQKRQRSAVRSMGIFTEVPTRLGRADVG